MLAEGGHFPVSDILILDSHAAFERLHLVSLLGRGSQASVFQVTLDCRHVALKCMRRQDRQDASKFRVASGRLLSEAQALRQCHGNRNVCQLLGVLEFPASHEVAMYDGHVVTQYPVLALMLELAKAGSIREKVRDQMAAPEVPIYSDGEALCWVRDVACGLFHLHQRNIAHRDVKLDNVLLAVEGEELVAKLGDLGLALDMKSKPAAPPSIPGCAREGGWGDGDMSPHQAWAEAHLLAFSAFPMGQATSNLLPATSLYLQHLSPTGDISVGRSRYSPRHSGSFSSVRRNQYSGDASVSISNLGPRYPRASTSGSITPRSGAAAGRSAAITPRDVWVGVDSSHSAHTPRPPCDKAAASQRRCSLGHGQPMACGGQLGRGGGGPLGLRHTAGTHDAMCMCNVCAAHMRSASSLPVPGTATPLPLSPNSRWSSNRLLRSDSAARAAWPSPAPQATPLQRSTSVLEPPTAQLTGGMPAAAARRRRSSHLDVSNLVRIMSSRQLDSGPAPVDGAAGLAGKVAAAAAGAAAAAVFCAQSAPVHKQPRLAFTQLPAGLTSSSSSSSRPSGSAAADDFLLCEDLPGCLSYELPLTLSLSLSRQPSRCCTMAADEGAAVAHQQLPQPAPVASTGWEVGPQVQVRMPPRASCPGLGPAAVYRSGKSSELSQATLLARAASGILGHLVADMPMEDSSHASCSRHLRSRSSAGAVADLTLYPTPPSFSSTHAGVPSTQTSVASKHAFVGKSTTTGVMGTLGYLAPEVARGLAYGLSADVFSFGMVAYAILARSTPLEDRCLRSVHGGMQNLQDRLVQGYRPPKPLCMRPQVWALIQDCLAEDCSVRPNMALVMARLEDIIRGVEDEPVQVGSSCGCVMC